MYEPNRVISIQSQVVYGHVGNSAAVFPMQAAGIEVIAVPTVILSNTPRYPTLRGKSLPPALLTDLLLGVKERGLVESADMIVTGYLGSPENAAIVADFVTEALDANPRLGYLCDPVMGDAGPGIYVPKEVTTLMRQQLLHRADILTPNQFELEFLTGTCLERADDMARAAADLPLRKDARIIATGCSFADTPAGQIETVILHDGQAERHAATMLDGTLSGTGDLFAGLLVASLGRGHKLSDAVIRAQELTGIAMRDAIHANRMEVTLSGEDFRRGLLTL